MVLSFSFATSIIYAGTPTIAKQFINHKDWNFVENKGQLTTTEIKYYGHQGGVYLYCQPGKISFMFTKTEQKQDVSEATGQPVQNFKSHQPQPSSTTTDRADLVLVNANPSTEITASDQQEYYENYYTTGDADHGITNVHTYKSVTYKNVYPNIDMVIRAKENGMKYEFVVYPGGDVGDIQIRWNGLENMEMTENGGIKYACALGTMRESKPVSFQGDNIIASSFVRHNDRIRFKVNGYDKTKTLVIDPTLIWGTYFASSFDCGGYDVKTDASGNVYMTGFIEGVAGTNSIATSGAYQTSYGGGYAAFLVKFNTSGKRLWATYFGASSTFGSGIALDGSGNLYITGKSSSQRGIATLGAYQTVKKGTTNITSDAFLAKFTINGKLIWATYYGGDEEDDAYGVATDISGNVYITGYTQSDSGIATSGAYQTSYSGTGDAFLAKFNGSGNILWATYYGGNNTTGSSSDEVNGICIDVSGNVYIASETSSTNGIASSGAFQTSNAGNVDAFLAKFSSSGVRLWATYYGGANPDAACRIITDTYGNVYMTGYTSSNNGIATSDAHQLFLDGPEDAFLAKFSSSGTRLWATYYGGYNSEQAFGICSNASGDIYITGFTGSKINFATSGAYQTSFGGGYEDAFIAKFSSLGNLAWSTYFGGNGLDYGWGICTDITGNIYLTGVTESTNNISTSGAYQVSHSGLLGDAFLEKFNFPTAGNDAGISSIISPQDSFCPVLQIVDVKLDNFGTNNLDSIKIGWSVNGKVQTPYNWFGNLPHDSTATINLGNYNFQSGIDTIKVWTTMPNGQIDSFPGNDTARIIMDVYALPAADAGPDTILCYNETYTMQGSGGITYVWHPATYLSSSTNPNAIAVLPNTEQYMLVVSNSHGCQDSSPVLLKVRPKLKVRALALNNPVCYGQNITLYTIGSGGDSLHYQFQWVDDGLTGDTITEKGYKSGWHKVILSDNCSPVSVMDSVYVTVILPPKAEFIAVPANKVKINTEISFKNQSSNTLTYLWTFGNHDSSKMVSPVYVYTDSGDYKITLVAYGTAPCLNDTAYETIQITDNQITIYIPDAFTPNGDGINDVFDISGVGIKSYTYNIYNRWGEHLFEATPGHTGWDGTFKGKQVIESVYIYQMDVIDIEGQHHYVSGNILLMR